MQSLKKITLISCLIFLNSCKTLEIDQRHIRLVIERDLSNNRLYIDEVESGCWKRFYHYGLDFIGPLEDFMEVPMTECNKMTGHRNTDYAKAIKALDSARLDYNRCKMLGD